jgi:hypothetical protein
VTGTRSREREATVLSSRGTKFTTVKDLKKELGIGLLNSMCADLGITVKELNDV